MTAIMARMVRTTIMADGELLDQLRAIAKEEQISLGEVIRQGLEWRAATRRRPPSFLRPRRPRVEPTSDAALRDEEIILEYVRQKDERRRRDAGL
jgi:hypothetical protein